MKNMNFLDHKINCHGLELVGNEYHVYGRFTLSICTDVKVSLYISLEDRKNSVVLVPVYTINRNGTKSKIGHGSISEEEIDQIESSGNNKTFQMVLSLYDEFVKEIMKGKTYADRVKWFDENVRITPDIVYEYTNTPDGMKVSRMIVYGFIITSDKKKCKEKLSKKFDNSLYCQLPKRIGRNVKKLSIELLKEGVDLYTLDGKSFYHTGDDSMESVIMETVRSVKDALNKNPLKIQVMPDKSGYYYLYDKVYNYLDKLGIIQELVFIGNKNDGKLIKKNGVYHDRLNLLFKLPTNIGASKLSPPSSSMFMITIPFKYEIEK